MKVIHIRLSREVDNAFNPIQSIVEKTLQNYLNIGGQNVTIKISKQPDEYDEETGEVLSEIIVAQILPLNKNSRPLSVNKYFNTFHYRLFSTMVGISIAIASRIATRINLPLVMDDIFYASDLENRATFEKFLKSLFDLFGSSSYGPGMELQLIFFTHDQQIFENAIQASAMNEVENIAFAKLFPYSESEEMDDYRNIIYKIPTYLPSSIMQNLLIEV